MAYEIKLVWRCSAEIFTWKFKYARVKECIWKPLL